MSSGSAFLRFWWTDNTRNAFLSHVAKDDLHSVRLACHDFSVRAAPLLFREVAVTFRPSSFTKPARMAALQRIGHHIETFQFNMSHGPETFLPPLLDPVTGEEQTFVYTPHIQSSRVSASRLSVPKYGSWEMTDLLVKQYPPLFHAATDVPSFIRAFSAMPCMTHLVISCPGQDSALRYRRSVVDYALISVRIAAERASLPSLNTLSLLPIHPSGVFYLRPIMSFGTLPNSVKRWTQIDRLAIHMDSCPFDSQTPVDHLRLLHSYLELFKPSLKRFLFRWRGNKGPSPLSFSTEPCFLPSPSYNTSSAACPTRSTRPPGSLRFPRLRYMELENAVLDATQISSFITSHRRTLYEFNFEDVILRTGTWEEALAPLTRISGSETWKQKAEEVMEVPIILDAVGLGKGEMEQVMWESEKERSKFKERKLFGGLHKAGSRGREIFWGGPEHMKKFLRSSIFSWR